MSRLGITVSIAAVLLIAVAVGWISHWLWSRLSRSGSADVDRIDDMATRLYAAEVAAAESENALAGARGELERQLAEREAELAAAMEGLGDARREIEDWRRAYEDVTSGR